MTIKTPPTEQTAVDQLEKLAAEFTQWRKQKKNPADPIPVSLLQEAQRLTQHYKVTTVRKRLGISKAQMDKLHDMEKSSSPTEPEFVELTKQTLSPTLLAKELKIEVQTPQGMTITLSGFTGNVHEITSNFQ